MILALGSIGVSGILFFVFSPPIVILLVNCLLIALLISDYIISHKHIKLLLKRTGDHKLSINEEEEITFEVVSQSQYVMELTLLDEIPDFHFECESPEVHIQLQSGERKAVGYKVIPRKRGAFQFGNIHLRIVGRLGLYSEYIVVPMKEEYKVYPNLQALKKYRLGAYRNILERQERKAVKKLSQGTAFESLREYVVGDEYRKINWAASARSNKLIVNQYEPEKNQRIYTFIDTGRPMSYTLRGECKLDKAINTSLILSDVVMRSGDLAGTMCFNEKLLNLVMPGKGSAHRDKLMEALYHLDSNHCTSNYEDAFLYFRGMERRSSIIFLFTDFDTFEEADIIAHAAGAIGMQHILVVVLIKPLDVEEMAKKKAVTEDEIYQKSVALELLRERRKAIARLNRKNVLCIETEPEKLEWTVINKYIELKSK